MVTVEQIKRGLANYAAAEEIIAEHRRTKGDPPADMLAVYRYVHGKETEKAKEIKIIQAMYG